MDVPMNEPTWYRQSGALYLLMPEPPYVRRSTAGHITKHKRKRHYYVHYKKGVHTFVDLDEAKAWLLATARLEN